VPDQQGCRWRKSDKETNAARPRTLRSVSENTPALRALEGSTLRFEVVRTERANSAEESAALQGIDIGRLLRTIVVRRGAGDYVFVLVPGGRQIDWPKLRAHLGVGRISLPDAEEARAVTGYERGAITPLGSLVPWPVVADATVSPRDRVAIGGGAPGVNLHVVASDLLDELRADVADVTRPAEERAREPAEGRAKDGGGNP
jgi:Cys-tRNA(Pro)/Cys-tRNA(Cys) deacylase